MSLEDAIKATKRLGLTYISLKDFHLPMNSTAAERREVAEKVSQAGLRLMGCGVVYMKDDQQQVRSAFEYARDARIPTIVASPDPAAIPIVDRMVKEFDIKVAIHNHGPEDKKYPTPESVAKAIEGYDNRIGLCIDIDHTVRAGLDPSKEIRRYASRLYELHYKDVDKAAPGGKTIEAGRGVIDLPAVLKALLDIKFQYHVALEYEKDEYDPIPGMAESIGYTRGVLTMM
jgi:sugar phosphate isomerase/epimerase